MYSPEYKVLQEQFHRECDAYGISGHKYADQIIGLSRNLQTRDILDYGCGKCTLQKSMPFPIQNYDPFIPEHSTHPIPADVVVCTDVMEHIEPDFVEAVLKDICALTKKAVFFQIATRPAVKILPDGRNAHLTQRSCNWWLDKLLPLFDIKAFQEMPGGLICICAHREVL